MTKLWRFCIFIILLIVLNNWGVFAEIGSNVYSSDIQNPTVLNEGGVNPTGEVIWEFHKNDYIYSSSPVINGVFYFGSGDHKLTALDANTGIIKWEFIAKETDETPGINKPLIYDGIVYYGAADHNLYAIDINTGKMIWEFNAEEIIGTEPVISNGIIYFGNWEDTVYALDAKTGDKIWDFHSGEGVRKIITVTNELVIVLTTNDKIFALNANTGDKIWEFDSGWGLFSENPIFFNQIIYFKNSGNEIIALDANTGEIKWINNSGDCILASPEVFNGIIYATSNKNKIFAFNANTGEIIWSFQLGNYDSKMRKWFSPIFFNGVIYVGSMDNILYALDANTGNILWEHTTDNLDFYSPDESSGILYVGSDSGSDINAVLLNPKIEALDANTGDIIWEYYVSELFPAESPLIAGNSYSLFGPKSFNGLVYITNYDGDVYAIGKSTYKLSNLDIQTFSTAIPSTLGSTEIASAFSFIQNPRTSPLEISFTDQSSGNPTSWLWDFGDGTTDDIQNPTHIYASEGTYNVSLTASNKDSIALREKKKVTIINTNSPSSPSSKSSPDSSSLPDLSFISSSVFYDPESNSLSNLTIKNRGNGKAGRFQITYFLTDTKTNHPFMDNDTTEYILDRDDVNGLESGAIRDNRSNKSIHIDDINIKSGTYWFGIMIDSRNVIDESDEENNVLYDLGTINL